MLLYYLLTYYILSTVTQLFDHVQASWLFVSYSTFNMQFMREELIYS